MDKETVVHSLAVHLAAKSCDGTPEDIVEKYFEMLPAVKAAYAEHKQEQPKAKLESLDKSLINL